MAFSGPLTVFVANNMGWRAAYAGGRFASSCCRSGSSFSAQQKRMPRAEKPFGHRLNDNSPFRLPLISFAACALGFLLYNFCKAFHSTWLPTIFAESYGYTSASAASVTFIQSMLAPAASVLSGIYLGGAACAGSQSCDGAALANDPRIWDGFIARSDSTCARRRCASRNFLLRGCYINFSAHLERSRRHFLTRCKGRPSLGLS